MIGKLSIGLILTALSVGAHALEISNQEAFTNVRYINIISNSGNIGMAPSTTEDVTLTWTPSPQNKKIKINQQGETLSISNMGQCNFNLKVPSGLQTIVQLTTGDLNIKNVYGIISTTVQTGNTCYRSYQPAQSETLLDLVVGTGNMTVLFPLKSEFRDQIDFLPPFGPWEALAVDTTKQGLDINFDGTVYNGNITVGKVKPYRQYR